MNARGLPNCLDVLSNLFRLYNHMGIHSKLLLKAIDYPRFLVKNFCTFMYKTFCDNFYALDNLTNKEVYAYGAEQFNPKVAHYISQQALLIGHKVSIILYTS